MVEGSVLHLVETVKSQKKWLKQMCQKCMS